MKPPLAWALAASGALCLVLIHEGTLVRATDDFNTADAKDLGGISEIRQLISERWVEQPEEGQLLNGALQGMVGTLDRFSDFISAAELQEFEESTTGKFGGLGIYISVEEGLVKVIAPIEDTPAWHAGILPGDTILEVDGVPCEFANSGAAVRSLKGEAGTTVVLTVVHEGAQRAIKIEIERAIIQIRSVKGTRLLEEKSRVGYLRITTFNSGTVEEFKGAVDELNAQGMRALILDLRGNPGGFLAAATRVADTLLDEDEVIVKTRGRDAEFKETKSTGDRLVKVPTALLIDRGSASASEILGGALHDHERAVLVGTRSYGKGSVQSIIPVLGGQAELKLTTQYYFTPKGRRIHRGKKDMADTSWGLIPDHEVVVERELRNQLLEKQAEFEMARLKALANKQPLGAEERLHIDDPQVRAAFRVLLEQLGDPVPVRAAGSDVAAIDSKTPSAPPSDGE